MTEQKLAKVDQDHRAVKGFSQVLLVGFMVTGLVLSGSLLNWAIGKKLSSIAKVNSNPITAEMRERQLACLARNIYYEAGSEPFEGKVAVAQVTLNRAANSDFPSDVCKVVYQKNAVYEKVLCQFSWYCDRATMMKPVNKAVYEESMEVAKKVLLEDFRLPSLKEALYFHGDYVNPGWKREKLVKIGRHIFYK